MKTNKKQFKFKRIPYYVSLLLLTCGASLILGFLSFGGAFALAPILPLAVGAFVLSVAYEGEIYLQNIKGALAKLFKGDYLSHQLAKNFLLKHFPDTNMDNCPQFFKDYQEQLKLFAALNHKKLSQEQKNHFSAVKRRLKDMEQWFASQLYPSAAEEALTSYAESVHIWLKQQQQQQWALRLQRHRVLYRLAGIMSVLSALFMGLGSTYLIVEACSVIPFVAVIPFAFWPLFIAPMAVIAGIAYGFLIYNTLTDLISQQTLQKWYQNLRNDFRQGITARNIFLATMSVVLAGLAITLTICTAGTWWTVASNTRPLFTWMSKMPSFIMRIINPIITGLSAVFFNLQNTSESLEMLAAATNPQGAKLSFWQRLRHQLRVLWEHLQQHENIWQQLNPFRLLLKITLTPLRLLLFLGHLVSIAFTADRMPGIPQIAAALVALISEGFEDAHYFIPAIESEEHPADDIMQQLEERLGDEAGHEHHTDIPTRLLKNLALPIYILAAIWDWLASRLPARTGSQAPLTWNKAWEKQRGNKTTIDAITPETHLSPDWKKEHTLCLLKKYQHQHLQGAIYAQKKIAAFNELQEQIFTEPAEATHKVIVTAHKSSALNQHRLFGMNQAACRTQQFLSQLPERVGLERNSTPTAARC